jgi:hypothetical protein
MPVVTLMFSALGSQIWVPERDVVVTGFMVYGANARAVLSYDPGATSGGFSAPSANGIDRNLISAAQAGVPQSDVNATVTAGEGATVAISAAGSAIISFEWMTGE